MEKKKHRGAIALFLIVMVCMCFYNVSSGTAYTYTQTPLQKETGGFADEYNPRLSMSQEEWDALGSTPDNPWVIQYVSAKERIDDEPSYYYVCGYTLFRGNSVNWLCAHRGTANGNKIFFEPEYIQVDGMMFRYTKNVEIDIFNRKNPSKISLNPEYTPNPNLQYLALETCLTDEEKVQFFGDFDPEYSYQYCLYYEQVV